MINFKFSFQLNTSNYDILINCYLESIENIQTLCVQFVIHLSLFILQS